MSEQVAGVLISLHADADQKSFEDFLAEQSAKEQVFGGQSLDIHFHFCKQVCADRVDSRLRLPDIILEGSAEGSQAHVRTAG